MARKKKTRKTAGTSEAPPMLDAVTFDGLESTQRFNVGPDRSFVAGETHTCELDSKRQPKDEALAAALEAGVASLTQVPDPAAEPAAEEVS